MSVSDVCKRLYIAIASAIKIEVGRGNFFYKIPIRNNEHAANAAITLGAVDINWKKLGHLSVSKKLNIILARL